MNKKLKILVATKNSGKLREIKKLLGPVFPKGAGIFSLFDLKDPPIIVENGKTYLDNALKKAKAIANTIYSVVISDDSGLEVGALNNRPGVKSSRFSGKNANDKRNNKKLLKLLKNLKKKDRKARFVCTAVAYFPASDKYVFSMGSVSGYIIDEEIGSGGFGYDPLFYFPPLKKTFAQIPLFQKNKISHRYKAFKKLSKKLMGTEIYKANDFR